MVTELGRRDNLAIFAKINEHLTHRDPIAHGLYVGRVEPRHKVKLSSVATQVADAALFRDNLVVLPDVKGDEGMVVRRSVTRDPKIGFPYAAVQIEQDNRLIPFQTNNGLTHNYNLVFHPDQFRSYLYKAHNLYLFDHTGQAIRLNYTVTMWRSIASPEDLPDELTDGFPPELLHRLKPKSISFRSLQSKAFRYSPLNSGDYENVTSHLAMIDSGLLVPVSQFVASNPGRQVYDSTIDEKLGFE